MHSHIFVAFTRYATILFGGDGVLDKPHPVVQDNKIFTSYEEIGKHMASLAIGENNVDSQEFTIRHQVKLHSLIDS